MTNRAVVCLDETGSMRGQEKRVVTSMNEYVEQLPKSTRITVFKFDSTHWTKFFDGAKSDWKEMKEGDYTPGAMTPLYDAVAKAIEHAKSAAKAKDKVMVMIDTDGFENASKEQTQDSIKAYVEQQKKAGWEFLFMASGLDEKAAVAVGATGQSIGTQVLAATYSNRGANYAAAASTTNAYFNSGSTVAPDKDEDAEEDENVQPFFATTASTSKK